MVIVVEMLASIFLFVGMASAAPPSLTWFAASDTHLGHDAGVGANRTTSYTKNVWAINEMNSLPNNGSWPSSLGGGPVQTPAGVTISGDLIDGGVNSANQYDGCAQWANFTALYGLNGTDGMIKSRVYEGRGNHDGKNSSLLPPTGCAHSPTGWIIERNAARLADPSFSITGISEPTGLHYSWTWNVSTTCAVHFVQMGLFPGRGCGSAANPNGEGTPGPGFPCKDGDLSWAENSLGFLETDLAAHAGPGVLTVTIQHYGFDSFSNGWYNKDQREELIATLNKYNPLIALVGHTHSAELYSYNGSVQAPWGRGGAGFVDVVNAPATQKEDGHGNPLPSEFMALEVTMDGPLATTGRLRVAQRVGSAWGTVLGEKNFTCAN